jgi:hypothetical protein
MANPGSNLLNRARKLIKFGSVRYFAATGRTMNSARQWVTTFVEDEKPLSCSVQAVARSLYSKQGLDFNKFYVNVWASRAMVSIDRDTSGDRFIYNGALYAFSDGYDWFEQDGWATVLAVRIKLNATTADL